MDSKSEKQPQRGTIDDILARLDRPEVEEKRQELAKFLGLDGDLMEATLLHLAADLLPMSQKSAAKLRGRANYDLCKFAGRQGAKMGEKVREALPEKKPAKATSKDGPAWAIEYLERNGLREKRK